VILYPTGGGVGSIAIQKALLELKELGWITGDLLAAQSALARDEGTWICPDAAACFAAVAELRGAGWLGGGEDVVVLNTGSGLLYPDTVPVHVPTLAGDGVIPA
jgi:hypothetical protein